MRPIVSILSTLQQIFRAVLIEWVHSLLPQRSSDRALPQLICIEFENGYAIYFYQMNNWEHIYDINYKTDILTSRPWFGFEHFSMHSCKKGSQVSSIYLGFYPSNKSVTGIDFKVHPGLDLFWSYRQLTRFKIHHMFYDYSFSKNNCWYYHQIWHQLYMKLKTWKVSISDHVYKIMATTHCKDVFTYA